MAYYRRRYRRYRPRRYVRRWFRRRFRRYVNGSSRSTVRMKTAVDFTTTATAGYGLDATDAQVVSFAALQGTTGAFAVAARSSLYKTYCSLYEECKVIGMKVSLSVVSAVGGADIPSVQIYTSWDRKYGRGEPDPTVKQIKDSATSNVSTCLNNNVAKIIRSCYASDLIEKATWFDASLDDTNGNCNKAWYTASTNPNMFSPQFSFFLNCPSKGATQNVSVSIACTYYFGFRNPRFGGSANSRTLDLGERSAFIADNDDNMDDGDGALLPDAPPDVDGAAEASADEPARRSVLSKAPKQTHAARVVQLRRDQHQRRLADESLNA